MKQTSTTIITRLFTPQVDESRVNRDAIVLNVLQRLKFVALIWAVSLCGLLGPAITASAENVEPCAAIKQTVDAQLKTTEDPKNVPDPRLSVELADDCKTLRLKGTVHDQEELAALIKLAQELVPKTVQKVDGEALKVNAAAGSKLDAIKEAIKKQLQQIAVPADQDDPRVTADFVIDNPAHPLLRVRLTGTVRNDEELNQVVSAVVGVVGTEPANIVSFLLSDASAPEKSGAIARKSLETLLNDPRLTVTAVGVPLLAGGYKTVVTVTGKLRSKTELKQLSEIADGLLGPKQVIINVTLDETASTREDALAKAKKPPPDNDIVATWPLTFSSDQVHSSFGANGLSEQVERYRIDTLVDLLNSTYGTKDVQPVHTARHALEIKGSESTVLKIKRDLVLLDSPSPQVRLDVWAVQISGDNPNLEGRVKDINTRLGYAHDFLTALQIVLSKSINANMEPLKTAARNLESHDDRGREASPEEQRTQILIGYLNRAGFNIYPNRPLSLSESLIFLAILPYADRKNVLDAFDSSVQTLLKQVPKDKGFLPRELYERWTAQNSKDWHPFPRLREHYLGIPPYAAERSLTDKSQVMTFQEGIFDFLIALDRYNYLTSERAYKDLSKSSETYNSLSLDAPAYDKAVSERNRIWKAPETLSQQAADVDGMFSRVMDAVSGDVQDLVLDPLLECLGAAPAKGQQSGDGGVKLLGRTRIVVSSGLESALLPALSASIDVTRPAPLGVTDVTSAIAKGGLADTLTKLSNPQLVLLQAALSSVPPAYARVAPGAELHVRPAVMPDAGSARLQIDANFGVTTSFPEGQKDRKDILQPQPFNAVESHHVQTDAIVDTLDLFGVSSLDMETSTPQGPFVVPILGRLPIFGPMFQLPRGDKKVHHHSLILVNTVILPRALDIVRFYGNFNETGHLPDGNSFSNHVRLSPLGHLPELTQ